MSILLACDEMLKLVKARNGFFRGNFGLSNDISKIMATHIKIVWSWVRIFRAIPQKTIPQGKFVKKFSNNCDVTNKALSIKLKSFLHQFFHAI